MQMILMPGVAISGLVEKRGEKNVKTGRTRERETGLPGRLATKRRKDTLASVQLARAPIGAIETVRVSGS